VLRLLGFCDNLIMTISEAYDRLLAARVSAIEWKDGNGPLRCVAGPMVVRDVSTDENADAWIETSEEGCCLHFNAKDQWGEWRGQTEPLSNIARIV
jgi:hypothetical protein